MKRHNRLTGAAGKTERGKATNKLQPRGTFIPADDPRGQVGTWGTKTTAAQRLVRRLTGRDAA